jgi:hypothetical protein
VLQDMALPSHTRNDYIVAQLRRLGGSPFDRGSRYQRFVSLAYGRTALPRFTGSPPRRDTVAAYFVNPQWTGLANLTHLRSFSPGTLPEPQIVSRTTQASDLLARIRAGSRYQEPTIRQIDLRCAHRRSARCYVRDEDGRPLARYRVDREQRLRFALDRHTAAATAQYLVPRAVGFSIGLINHLFRGALELEWDSTTLVVTNRGPKLQKYKLTVLLEGASGKRRTIKELEGDGLAGDQHRTLLLPELPGAAPARLVVLVEGTDSLGERVFAQRQVQLD